MRLTDALRALGMVCAVSALSGCALPPVVSVASFAFDFASYGETGKTVTDHGISFVLQEDCALLRVFQGELCRPNPGETPETAMVALEPMSEPITSVDVTRADSMVLPLDLAYLDDAEGALFAAPTGVAAIALVPPTSFVALADEDATALASFDGLAYLSAR